MRFYVIDLDENLADVNHAKKQIRGVVNDEGYVISFSYTIDMLKNYYPTKTYWLYKALRIHATERV